MNWYWIEWKNGGHTTLYTSLICCTELLSVRIIDGQWWNEGVRVENGDTLWIHNISEIWIKDSVSHLGWEQIEGVGSDFFTDIKEFRPVTEEEVFAELL